MWLYVTIREYLIFTICCKKCLLYCRCLTFKPIQLLTIDRNLYQFRIPLCHVVLAVVSVAEKGQEIKIKHVFCLFSLYIREGVPELEGTPIHAQAAHMRRGLGLAH